MANEDAEWVDDVRRWYYGGNAPAGDRDLDNAEMRDPAEAVMGYEAAHPTLQSRHWCDAAASAEH
jgi:hypothetical protein